MAIFDSGHSGGYFAAVKCIAPGAVVAASLYLSTLVWGVEFDGRYLVLAVLAAVLTHVLLKPVFDEATLEYRGLPSVVGRLWFGWFLVISMLLLLGYAAKMTEEFSRLAFFSWVLAGGALLPLTLIGIRSLRASWLENEEFGKRIVVAGLNDVSLKLARTVERNPDLGLAMHGFFEDRQSPRFEASHDFSVLGRLSDMPDYVRRNRVDVVFIALPIRHLKRVMQLLDELQDSTVSIYYLPDVFVFDLIQSRVETMHGLPLIALCETPFVGYRGLAKRLLDVCASAAAIVALLPLFALIAAAIRMDSKGPVIFRQRRYGVDGEEIIVYKFRTMTVLEDGDKVVQATRGDARITRTGKWLRKSSFDELPQLFNVLGGSMSLVGPRPHAVAHNEEYRKLIKGYMIRHKVPPGITGWAQVNGFRGETACLDDMKSRVEYDLEYLRNWSFTLDLRILVRTVSTIWNADKAY